MLQKWLCVILCVAHLSSVAVGALPPCDTSKRGQEVCADFCDYRCSFYNASVGERGGVQNITVYRITPKNVTGIKNKDTGNAPGDVGFFLSKKNLTAQCAKDPASFGCFLDGDDIYGRFVVEIDGGFGPYFECNPKNVGQRTAAPWTDTRNFMCGQGCLRPNATGCHGFDRGTPRNGSNHFGSVQCFCDSTARHNLTVGREPMPYSSSSSDNDLGPAYWVPQCRLSYYEYYNKSTDRYGGCLDGKSYKEVQGWSFDSVTALACDTCDRDPSCAGWRTLDNRSATLFTGKLVRSTERCIGGEKWVDPYGGGGGNWGSAGNTGGYWYSTPVTAECPEGATIGTAGCSWRVLEATYRNASCVDNLVDAAVEAHGKVCFDSCPQPLNRLGNCYLQCYKNTLLGDAAYNVSAMQRDQIVKPWERGFLDGGCPKITPARCEGPQCGP